MIKVDSIYKYKVVIRFMYKFIVNSNGDDLCSRLRRRIRSCLL